MAFLAGREAECKLPSVSELAGPAAFFIIALGLALLWEPLEAVPSVFLTAVGERDLGTVFLEVLTDHSCSLRTLYLV